MKLLLLLVCTIGIVNSSGDILYKILNDGYKNYIPPNDDKSTEVKLGFYINSFYAINAQTMEYSISYYLRMAWNDPRLKFADNVTRIQAPDGSWNEIWTPDLFMRNEKKSMAMSILRPQRLLSIKSDGDLWYVVKITSALSCPMKLQKFPFDTQICPIMIESYRYTMDTIKLSWLDAPVDVDRDVQIPEFTMMDIVLHDCSQNYTAGAFPCLEARFVLDRDVGYYILVVFIPSILLVTISWLQFWLSPDAIVARVILGLFTTFTLVSQMTSLRTTLPKVTYVTALDVWMTACLLFVVASLIEGTVVHYLQKEKSGTSRIDKFCRFIIPIIFLVFSIIYWCVYTA